MKVTNEVEETRTAYKRAARRMGSAATSLVVGALLVWLAPKILRKD